MKNLVIINPNILYDQILQEGILFKNYKLKLLNYIENDSISITELKSLSNIFIDDYNDNYNLNTSIKNICYSSGISIKSLTEFYEKKMGRAAIFEYQNIIYIPPYFNNLKENIYFKLFIRFFDILVVFILSPFAIIILFFSILTLYIKSGTPIFFTQKRIGKNGLTFTIFKLRTMNLNNSNNFTIINDNRIFPLGKFFRKYKIDEIPQLINILLGHMSIFGPRPERLDLHLIIINKYPEFQKRLLVRPGLTGWAQIKNPLATPNDSFEKLKYDIYFIKYISIKMILNIIISTINILINKKSL